MPKYALIGATIALAGTFALVGCDKSADTQKVATNNQLVVLKVAATPCPMANF